MGAVEEREVFLCCFAAAPHPSAALTPNELWSNRHRRSTYLYSLRSAAPSRGRLWCRTDSPESGVNSEILLRQSLSQNRLRRADFDSSLYTREPLGRCRASATVRRGDAWRQGKTPSAGNAEGVADSVRELSAAGQMGGVGINGSYTKDPECHAWHSSWGRSASPCPWHRWRRRGSPYWAVPHAFWHGRRHPAGSG